MARHGSAEEVPGTGSCPKAQVGTGKRGFRTKGCTLERRDEPNRALGTRTAWWLFMQGPEPAGPSRGDHSTGTLRPLNLEDNGTTLQCPSAQDEKVHLLSDSEAHSSQAVSSAPCRRLLRKPANTADNFSTRFQIQQPPCGPLIRSGSLKVVELKSRIHDNDKNTIQPTGVQRPRITLLFNH